MRVRDTMGGGEVELRAPGPVRMYLCGVTAYDESHVGHARTVVVFDVMRRRLEASGARVELVQNFTDVDDKIVARAAAEGVTAAELSSRYIAEYHETARRLGVLPASAYPRATGHVGGIIGVVSRLVEAGAAYAAESGVYFDVSRFPRYGRLSGKDTAGLVAGARVEAAAGKRSPLDFALWKLGGGEPSWDSPWGRGRPGWHVECSAMCLGLLGDTVDVHGGGRDLIFPHHENEIAQSETLTGRPLARAWVHVGMVTAGGEKMSKSLGNAVPAARMLDEWGPNVSRLFCLGAHYHKPADYTGAAMAAHRDAWAGVRLAHHSLDQGAGPGPGGPAAAGLLAEFGAALDADLNTPLAIGAMRRLAALCLRGGGGDGREGAAGALAEMAGTLGLRLASPAGPARARIEGEVARRAALRAEGRYAEADAARGALAAEGVELVDGPGGTVWLPPESA